MREVGQNITDTNERLGYNYLLQPLFISLLILSLLFYVGYSPRGIYKIPYLDLLGYLLVLFNVPFVISLILKVFPFLKRNESILLLSLCFLLLPIFLHYLNIIRNDQVLFSLTQMLSYGFWEVFTTIILHPLSIFLITLGLAFTLGSTILHPLDGYTIPFLSLERSPRNLVIALLSIALLRVAYYLLPSVVFHPFDILILLSIPLFSIIWLGTVNPKRILFLGIIPAISAWLLAYFFTPLHVYPNFMSEWKLFIYRALFNTFLLQVAIILWFSYFYHLMERVNTKQELWKLIFLQALVAVVAIILILLPPYSLGKFLL